MRLVTLNSGFFLISLLLRRQLKKMYFRKRAKQILENPELISIKETYLEYFSELQSLMSRSRFLEFPAYICQDLLPSCIGLQKLNKAIFAIVFSYTVFPYRNSITKCLMLYPLYRPLSLMHLWHSSQEFQHLHENKERTTLCLNWTVLNWFSLTFCTTSLLSSLFLILEPDFILPDTRTIFALIQITDEVSARCYLNCHSYNTQVIINDSFNWHI